MAGIYVHIPWCRKACIYCDFHFSLSAGNKPELLASMIREIEMQKDYLSGETIETLYLGGGTPSVLTSGELGKMVQVIQKQFSLAANAEITLEANPDDITLQYAGELKDLGFNRLSIGIQSFFDDDLAWMNRRHDAAGSVASIDLSKKAGFDNINIDLIYGLPDMDRERWRENLDIAFGSGIQHISAYHLTLEPKTIYDVRVRKGILKKPDETAGYEQFEMLTETAAKNGFIHYEISNFSLPDFLSRHNTSYWTGKPYLGIGPSACSYNGGSRQWNIRNNSLYIKSIRRGEIPFEYEELSPFQKYNEYVLTSLRTMWGADMEKIEREFGDRYAGHFIEQAEPLIRQGKIRIEGKRYVITNQGKFFADGIISDFFIV